MKKFVTVAAAIAALGFAGAASAADLPVKAVQAPVIAPDLWTGFYLGLSAGGRWNKDPWTATGFEIPAVPTFVTGRDNPHDFTSSSGRFGLYGGYNWRIQQMWVVGLEADVAWARNKSSNAGIPGLIGLPGGFGQGDTTQVKDSWDAGIRARAGYLITPTTLLYATGGVSWMKSEASLTCSTAGPPASWCTGTNQTSGRTDTASKTVVGWTLGGGIEGVIAPNWLLRGEYRYTNYQGYHVTLMQGGGALPNIDVVDADIGRIRTHTALIGLAYRFGGL